MGDINQRRSAYGKFYDLYIKVHENVRYRQQIGVTFIDRLLCSDSVYIFIFVIPFPKLSECEILIYFSRTLTFSEKTDPSICGRNGKKK